MITGVYHISSSDGLIEILKYVCVINISFRWMENANDIFLIRIGVDPPPSSSHVGDLLFSNGFYLQPDEYEFAYHVKNGDKHLWWKFPFKAFRGLPTSNLTLIDKVISN